MPAGPGARVGLAEYVLAEQIGLHPARSECSRVVAREECSSAGVLKHFFAISLMI